MRKKRPSLNATYQLINIYETAYTKNSFSWAFLFITLDDDERVLDFCISCTLYDHVGSTEAPNNKPSYFFVFYNHNSRAGIVETPLFKILVLLAVILLIILFRYNIVTHADYEDNSLSHRVHRDAEYRKVEISYSLHPALGYISLFLLRRIRASR